MSNNWSIRQPNGDLLTDAGLITVESQKKMGMWVEPEDRPSCVCPNCGDSHKQAEQERLGGFTPRW